MLEKYKAREIKAKISKILWEIWDPIGVKSIPQASDEYDGYVNGVYILLDENLSGPVISEHLLNIVQDQMGLTHATIADMAKTTEALLDLRRSEWS